MGLFNNQIIIFLPYDIVILDAFLGENPPWHLLTLESFKKIETLLNPNGILLIEFYGLIEGKMGTAGRSIYKTLLKSGYIVDIVGTRHDANERNFIYVASEKEFDFNNLNYSGKTYSDQPIDDLSKFLIEKSQIDLKNAIVLTDDKPALEILLMRPALEWRKKLNEIFRDRLVKDKQPIYY